MPSLAQVLLWASLSSSCLAGSVLSSSGFTNCQSNATIVVNSAYISFQQSTGTVYFDVSGTSTEVQKVTASLIVTAYGEQVFQKDFDPCDSSTYVAQLCPVPAGTFSANGSQVIPSQYLSQIPSIAFSIPDLDGQATLKLSDAGSGASVACIQSGVSNGKSVQLPAVSYVAAGIAGAALLLTGLSAISGAGAGAVGGHAPSPSFATVLGWFQSVAMNGMLSVNYPPIYRSFSQNFAFSGGLISWTQMQTLIDNFRASTGGNLIDNNVQFLQKSTLAFTDGQSDTTTFERRSAALLSTLATLSARDVSTAVNQSSSSSNTTTEITHLVYGIEGYVEQLSIPQANTFMTVLLFFALIIVAIAFGILLFKVILETWALFATFPKRLTGFRKRYWYVMAKSIVNLILLLYGVWTLYCIYQFTNGDSWAAKLLAGITLAIFTAILAFFTIRILFLARKYKKLEGDASALFENKDIWLKYSLFYDSYRRSYWWLFIPTILYMFAKGTVIAAGDGHGEWQAIGQLSVESLMLILLLWTRPFASRGSNIINIVIQVIRVLSIVCILVFVEQLGIAQTTKTITGLILIIAQASLTGILALLIAVNAIVGCCRESPHRRQRKELEKLRELDDLTPLDPHNSMLIEPHRSRAESPPFAYGQASQFGPTKNYAPVPQPARGPRGWESMDSNDGAAIAGSTAPPGYSTVSRDRSFSGGDDDTPVTPLIARLPTLPNVGPPRSYPRGRAL